MEINVRKSLNNENEKCFCLAKALFANQSDTNDELEFTRGQVLTVLEQNPNGLQGWWLCALSGRQGIAPANRLRLLPGMFDKTGLGYNGSCGHHLTASCGQINTTSGSNSGVTSGPLNGSRRRSWNCSQKESSRAPNTTIMDKNSRDNNSSLITTMIDNEYDFPRAPLPPQRAQQYGLKSASSVSSLDNNDSHCAPTLNHDSYDFPKASSRFHSNFRSTSEERLLIARNNNTMNASDWQPLYSTPVAPPSRSSHNSSHNSSHDSSSSSSSLCLSSLQSMNDEINELTYDFPPEPRKLESNSPAHSPPLLSQVIPPPPPPKAPPELLFYDIPKKPIFDAKEKSIPQLNSSIDISNIDFVYDFPKSKTELIEKKSNEIEVNYSRNYSQIEAQNRLQELQQKLDQSLTHLFHKFFVRTNWRSADILTSGQSDVDQLCAGCHRLAALLRQFLRFGFESVFSAKSNSSDNNLISKLRKLLNQLNDSLEILENTIQSIDEKEFWNFEKIVEKRANNTEKDDLDRFVCCARGLSEDIKSVSLFISGNLKLIFGSNECQMTLTVTPPPLNGKPPIAPKPARFSPKSRPLPALPPLHSLSSNRNEENGSEGEENDYESPDYVSFESKKFFEKQDLKTTIVDNNKSDDCSSDSRVISFYMKEVEKLSLLLKQSIECFVESIQRNETPKQLINWSKAVVICAQKVLFIAKTIERNVNEKQMKSALNNNCNQLCDALTLLVANTKRALTSPTIAAMNGIEESLVNVALIHSQFKLIIKVNNK